MSISKHIIQFLPIVLVWGMLLGSCSMTTDPTKSSSDFTSSTTPGSSSKEKPEEKATSFARDNFFRLKEDMALGKGEYLASFATLLGIPDDHQAEFFALAKEKFPSLVSSEQATADDMIMALNQELAAHPHLQDGIGQN